MRVIRSASVAVTLGLLLAGRVAAGLVETPSLEKAVKAGELPPVAQRVPEQPLEVAFSGKFQKPGRHGGELRLLMGRSKDIRLMVVYGYARLLGYDLEYRLTPDLLRQVDVEDGQVFTFHLRKGHRWSDGHPFTSEDFRYYWEDIAGNQDLSPFGPPSVLLVEEERPEFEVLDEHTVRFRWSRPNPYFLPAMAGARPETIYAPAHYLKQFHAKYANPAALQALAEEEGRRNWVAVHVARFRPYKNNNPDLPTLQPWVNTTRPPSQRFVFKRNPFYHRVDPAGRQLPYLDQVVMNISDGKLIPAKTGASETDLQARHLSFSDYTFLKQSEKRGQSKVLLWSTTKGSHIALFPNLNAEDPVWRELLRDVRFRRALSMAIDRNEINQVIYYGLARPGNDTVFPGSPLYKKKYARSGTKFSLKKANQLLDELGLNKRNDAGIRLLPTGEPMEIIVETAGEDTEQTDVLELIAATWKKVGIKLFSKPLQREVFRNRIFSGKTVIAVWGGLENGLPTADMSPRDLAPTQQQQLQWSKWGQHFESGGAKGEAPDLTEAKTLLELNSAWLGAKDTEARAEIWRQMLEIRAEQMYTIGIVSGVPQPVVINSKLRNVPTKGVYNWDPGAHFGIYHPDTFWYE